MKPYTGDEFVVAAHRSFFALYSYLKAVEKEGELEKYPIGARLNHPDLTLFIFYRDNFTLNLSELFTFFWNHDDQQILSRLKTSHEQRSKLRKLRHSNAHLGTVRQTLTRERDLDFANVLPLLFSDLRLIIHYIWNIIKEKESQQAADIYMEQIGLIEQPFASILNTGNQNMNLR